MSYLRTKSFIAVIMASLIFSVWPFFETQAASLPERLSGKILLQVQASGEAWYLNPVDLKRYYLGRPADAFTVMRNLGLGISEENYQQFQQGGAFQLKGRILLRVQSAGEAYYVNPTDSRLYYLGRPADAFAAMRNFGLGISNQDLSQITVANLNQGAVVAAPVVSTHTYNWQYQNQPYSLQKNLSTSLYQAYSTSPKVLTYYVGQEPIDPRESFYALFLKLKAEDQETGGILSDLKQQASALGLSSDQTAAFVLSFIQYIPYDQAKLAAGNDTPYYPFETLYLEKGVCADKTFLAVLWLRSLGYGAAILDFPDSNHSAAGIACPVADSLTSSGYCYLETTNYFPVGVVPPSINNGQAAVDVNDLDNLFDASRLGRMDIKQKSTGKIYQGVSLVKAEASAIKDDQANLQILKTSLETQEADLKTSYQALKQQESELLAYKSSGDISTYNQLVPAYNQAITVYQAQADSYNQAVVDYNQAANSFNERYRQFYQQ